jgi:hypothetical protein
VLVNGMVSPVCSPPGNSRPLLVLVGSRSVLRNPMHRIFRLDPQLNKRIIRSLCMRFMNEPAPTHTINVLVSRF